MRRYRFLHFRIAPGGAAVLDRVVDQTKLGSGQQSDRQRVAIHREKPSRLVAQIDGRDFPSEHDQESLGNDSADAGVGHTRGRF